MARSASAGFALVMDAFPEGHAWRPPSVPGIHSVMLG
jgi:hypothetical protein